MHKAGREAQAPGFKLDYLPPYSPDLNPIERVWKLTRRLCLHDQYFASLDSVIVAVEKEFTGWALGSATVRKLCALS
jgi:transposase